MVSDFLLPDVGEGLVEAELVSWQVAVGDIVKVNDIVCEIETAKSIVELPTPYAGEVAELLVSVGETVPVGTPLIRIAGEQAQGLTPGTLVGYGPRAHSTTRRARREAARAPEGRTGVHGVGPLAKPPVRALARELGVDLRTATPSGPKGDVTAADLGRMSSGSSPLAPPPHDVAEGRVTREPIKGLRKAMAEAMTASAFTLPHVTIWTTVDVTATIRTVERLKADPAYDGVRVSPLLVLACACIEALRRHQLLNSVWTEEEVVLRHFVNLGIAAATPRGLVVPNIKDADLLSLPDLGRAINRLTDVARDGRTQPTEQQGGTFTITNVGPFGIEGGTPIINPGESAILCFGAVARRPWVVGEDQLAIRDVCTLSLSFDHRHIDGATGSAFLADVAGAMSSGRAG